MRRIGCILFLSAGLSCGWLAAKNCDLIRIGAVPLPDLGSGLYRGYSGGLYPGGGNSVPADHLDAGLAVARTIQPLDPQGTPDPTGKVVLISVGMSNTAQEFFAGPNSFISRLQGDGTLNPGLEMVNCAAPGRVVGDWIDPSNDVYAQCEENLERQGVTPAQVQAAWIKQAEPGGGCCGGVFPDHALFQKGRLAQMVRVVKEKFPNLRIAHLSGRTRAYEDHPNALNPEPIAHETNFAVKWLIEDQIGGDPGLNYDPGLGVVRAPWLAWGPYLWVDGMDPRSDGLVWRCEDTAPDGIHPSQTGVRKVSDQLIAFYKTEGTATPWFLIPQRAFSIEIATEVVGLKPLVVEFRAVGAGGTTVAGHHWNFGDGLTSLSASPRKSYLVSGTYAVTLTATSATGGVASNGVRILVSSESDTRPDPPTNLRITILP
jgi:hypothetical protein